MTDRRTQTASVRSGNQRSGGRREARPQQPQSAALRVTVLRHLVAAALSLALLLAFWWSRPEWSPEMRLWRAVGDTSAVLLFLTLALGPLAKFSSGAGKALPWRRQLGVWAALTGILHGFLIIDGWARWSLRRFLGYEFVPQLEREVRLEPGFGLANLMGVVALVWMALLLATSSDRAVRLLGPLAWKWLQGGSYVVFYLVALHAAYFLFLHYTASFHRMPPEPNWFRFPLLTLAVAVFLLQWAAFARTVRRRRTQRS